MNEQQSLVEQLRRADAKMDGRSETLDPAALSERVAGLRRRRRLRRQTATGSLATIGIVAGVLLLSWPSGPPESPPVASQPAPFAVNQMPMDADLTTGPELAEVLERLARIRNDVAQARQQMESWQSREQAKRRLATLTDRRREIRLNTWRERLSQASFDTPKTETIKFAF